ncbi:hypothetical protein WMF31_17385 [Sorangium sp. So ce1036]|uniref:hypothetical protein n=1 Tax=Sorangium sp. So ce1036 TaxID=3133328 RepID=UPI003F013249
MRTMAFGAVGEVFVVVHGHLAPSDKEWNRYLDAVMAHYRGRSRVRTLIVTEGGAPSPAQWQRLVTHPEITFHKGKLCVVTDSTFVRGVVQGMDAPALNPISGQYQLFKRAQLLEALRELDASPGEQRAAIALVTQLEKAVGER